MNCVAEAVRLSPGTRNAHAFRDEAFVAAVKIQYALAIARGSLQDSSRRRAA